MTSPTASPGWQPVLPSHEIRPGENIVAGFVQGEEIALWRSLGGAAQAWENRCPHRGTRLTLGRILDGRLSCAYHGWEFEAGSGQCAAIPAQAQAAVPRNLCVSTWHVAETQGMVWVSSAEIGAPAHRPAANFIRSMSVRVGEDVARRALNALGFVEVERYVFHGSLADQTVTAYLNGAREDWIFLHLFTESAVSAPLRAAVRRLRATIEGQGGGA